MTTTGPFITSRVVQGRSASERLESYYKRSFRQKPVGVIPLPYVSRGEVSITQPSSAIHGSTLDAPNFRWSYDLQAGPQPNGWVPGVIRAAALNKCRDKFMNEAYENLELGMNIAERKQAMDMITKRATQITKAFSAAKKGRVKHAWNLLREKRGLATFAPKKWKQFQRWKYPKDAANLWLEFHFGWEQLYKDIYAAVKVLNEYPPHLKKVKARASAFGPVSYDTRGTYGGWVSRYDLSWYVTMGATLSVSNVPSFNLTRLGLVNPGSIAWEATPFSFVVDWFLPVGKFLNSYTDLIGVTLKDPYTTEYRVAQNGVSQCWQTKTDIGVYKPIEGFSYYMDRYLSIPGTILKPRQFKGVSPVRAATAIGLLIQTFGEHLPGLRKR